MIRTCAHCDGVPTRVSSRLAVAVVSPALDVSSREKRARVPRARAHCDGVPSRVSSRLTVAVVSPALDVSSREERARLTRARACRDGVPTRVSSRLTVDVVSPAFDVSSREERARMNPRACAHRGRATRALCRSRHERNCAWHNHEDHCHPSAARVRPSAQPALVARIHDLHLIRAHEDAPLPIARAGGHQTSLRRVGAGSSRHAFCTNRTLALMLSWPGRSKFSALRSPCPNATENESGAGIGTRRIAVNLRPSPPSPA